MFISNATKIIFLDHVGQKLIYLENKSLFSSFHDNGFEYSWKCLNALNERIPHTTQKTNIPLLVLTLQGVCDSLVL